MLVAALRPKPRGPELAVLVDDCLSGGAELIELEPLDVDEVAALVRAELGVPAGAGLTAAVGRAAGNPLWVVETVRTMASCGLLDLSGPMAEAASLELPDSLRHLVMRRLGYLPEATARTLRSASLVGDSFSSANLATITGRRAAELLEDLRASMDAGLVAESAGVFVFRHQLVRDAVYEDVPEAARLALHREAAAALEAAGAPLTQVASHLILGAVVGDVRAAASLRRAGGDVAPRSPAIAAELLRRAVSLLPDDDPERDAMQTELVEALLGAGENVQAGALASELLAHPLRPYVLRGPPRARARRARLGRRNAGLDDVCAVDCVDGPGPSRRGVGDPSHRAPQSALGAGRDGSDGQPPLHRRDVVHGCRPV